MNRRGYMGAAGSLITEKCDECGGDGCDACHGRGRTPIQCAGCDGEVTLSSFIGSDGNHYCAECAMEYL